MKFTVFGASGFIGVNLTKFLIQKGHEVFTPSREQWTFDGEHLGHVIYAIGLTGNFRKFPFETIEAHVTGLSKRMQNAHYDSWLYLSSTRVYGTSGSHASETDPISVLPGADGIYDISKLLGESLCAALEMPFVRVARLSNVYGFGQSQHTFLGSLLNDVTNASSIIINENADSAKDYVSILDVVDLVENVALHGKCRIYNFASGHSTNHQMLAQHLRQLTGLDVSFRQSAPLRIFPCIQTDRIRDEFNFVPRSLLDDLGDLVSLYKN